MSSVVDDQVALGQTTTIPTFPDLYECDVVALTGADHATTTQDFDNPKKYIAWYKSLEVALAGQNLAKADGLTEGTSELAAMAWRRTKAALRQVLPNVVLLGNSTTLSELLKCVDEDNAPKQEVSSQPEREHKLCQLFEK